MIALLLKRGADVNIFTAAIIADSTGGTVGLVEYVDNANPANRP